MLKCEDLRHKRTLAPKWVVMQTLLEANYSLPQTINKDVDLGSYKTGLYYLRFQNEKNVQMKPVIKM